MKGTLKNTKAGWFVLYQVMRDEITSGYDSIPLHPDSQTWMDGYNLYEGKEVEFEVRVYPSGSRFAKTIDEDDLGCSYPHCICQGNEITDCENRTPRQRQIMKNGLDEQYIDLLKDILENGVEKQTRNGKTLSVFGRSIRYKFKDGKFPLLTTKKMAWKTIVTELLWFLKGDTNIKFLVDNGCHIWDGDAYKAYLNRFKGGLEPTTKERFIEMIKNDEESRVNANGWFIGELGPIYGKQWRRWRKAIINPKTGYQDFTYVDQIQNLINDLKTNPDSRRLMVNAWNVGELDQMVLPPCHFSFQCYSHEKEGKRYLSLAWNQRSVDVGLGLPFNIASYGLLLEIIARSVNMIPYELIGNLGDCHIYSNHIDGVKEQLTREPFTLPTLMINSGNENWHLLDIDEIINSFDPGITFKVENYQSHSTIKLPLSN